MSHGKGLFERRNAWYAKRIKAMEAEQKRREECIRLRAIQEHQLRQFKAKDPMEPKE